MNARRVLTGALVVMSLALTLRFLHYEARLLGYPMQWDVREALSLDHALILTRGEPLYTVRYEPPLVVSVYGPVYPAVAAPLVAHFGVSLLGPRLVSGVSALGLLLTVFFATRGITGRASWGVIAVGALLMEFFWFRWLLLCRPDGLGNLLAFLALVVAWQRPRSNAAALVSAGLSVAAFFTKVYLIVAPAATLASYWLIVRDRRRAWLHTLTLAVLFSGALIYAGTATRGVYFLHGFEIPRAWTGVAPAWAVGLTAKMFVVYAPLWAALLIGTWRDGETGRYGALLAHVVIGTPAMALFLLNPGAGGFYWLVMLPALVIIGCDRLARETQDPDSPWAVVLLAALLAVMAVTSRGWGPVPSDELAAAWRPLADRVKAAEGPVMNDDATTLLNLINGKQLHMEGVGYEWTVRWLERTHGYRFADIPARIRSGYYALILSPEDPRPLAGRYELGGTYSVPAQMGEAVAVHVYQPLREAPR